MGRGPKRVENPCSKRRRKRKERLSSESEGEASLEERGFRQEEEGREMIYWRSFGTLRGKGETKCGFSPRKSNYG